MIKKKSKKTNTSKRKDTVYNKSASTTKSNALEKSQSRKEKEELKLALLLQNLLNLEISDDSTVVLNTAIPELKGLNFSERERECMLLVLNAERMNSPILNGSVKLRYRIELAAALLALVISKAHSMSESNRISKPNSFADVLVGLTVKRAKEIWSRRGS